MRRAYCSQRLPFAAGTSTDLLGIWEHFTSRFPAPPGYDPKSFYTCKGVETPANTYNFNYSEMTHLNWFAPAFLFNRGGIRWHYNVLSNSGRQVGSISVTRRTNQTLGANSAQLGVGYTTLAAVGSTLSGKMYRDWFNGTNGTASGTAFTNTNTQTGISVEMPMMTRFRLNSNRQENWLQGEGLTGADLDNYNVQIRGSPVDINNTNAVLEKWVSAGTDFNLYFFMNAPMIYYNPAMGNNPQ